MELSESVVSIYRIAQLSVNMLGFIGLGYFFFMAFQCAVGRRDYNAITTGAIVCIMASIPRMVLPVMLPAPLKEQLEVTPEPNESVQTSFDFPFEILAYLFLFFASMGLAYYLYHAVPKWIERYKSHQRLLSGEFNESLDDEYRAFFESDKNLVDVASEYWQIDRVHKKIKKMKLSQALKDKADVLRNKAHKQVSMMKELHEVKDGILLDVRIGSDNKKEFYDIAEQVFSNLIEIRQSLFLLMKPKADAITERIMQFQSLNVQANVKAMTHFNKVYEQGVRLVSAIEHDASKYNSQDAHYVKMFVNEELDTLYANYLSAADSYSGQGERPEDIFTQAVSNIDNFFDKVERGLPTNDALFALQANERFIRKVT